jgi:replicative DNA helicase
MTELADPFIASQFDRLPPQAIDAEMCAIASMMLEKDCIPTVRAIAHRETYYQADHQIVFDVLCQLYDQGAPVDGVILRAELDKRQLLEEIGGTAYLMKILESVPSAAHAAHYAKIVHEKYLLRCAISEANRVLRDAYAPMSGAPTELLQDAARRFVELASGSSPTRIVTLGDAVNDLMDAMSSGDVARLKTGLFELDDACGGLPFGKFTLIGGRPGMGKSQLSKQILRNVASAGVPCGLVTIEETEQKVAENCLSAESGVENNRIAFRTAGKEEWDAMFATLPRIGRLPFFINDEPTRLPDIEAAITTLAMKHKCRLVAVDYLQLIEGPQTDNENFNLTKISKVLKQTFKRLNIASLVSVQLNRGNEAGEVRPPRLRDLRGSGSLEQDGDLIVLLHRDDYYKRDENDYQPDHKLQAIIAKNKDNKGGIVPLFFDGKTQRVINWNGGNGDVNPFD